MTERLSDERVAAIATCRVERSLPDGGMWTASLWEVTELAREVLELRREVARWRSGDWSDHRDIPTTVLDCGDLCPAPPALGGEG